MTKEELNQRYSNLCVQLGDHLSKARDHELMAKAVVVQIDQLRKQMQEEESKNETES